MSSFLLGWNFLHHLLVAFAARSSPPCFELDEGAGRTGLAVLCISRTGHTPTQNGCPGGCQLLRQLRCPNWLVPIFS